MEKNLIKYDLKKMLKVLVIYYILSILVGGISRFFNCFNNIAIMRILYTIFSSIEYAIWGGIFVQTFVRVILRFNMNFYGDESYLTHTLPVTKKQLLISKYISGLLVILSSVLVLSVSVFIMFYSKTNIENLKQLLSASTVELNISTGMFLTLIVITFFAEICAIMSMCFSGIIIGKRFNTKKNMIATFVTIGFYIASVIFMLIIATIVFACMGNAGALWSNNISGSSLTTIFIVAIVTYLVLAVGFYFVSIWQFKKGVNVD